MLSITSLIRRLGLGLLIAILGLVVAGTPIGRESEEDIGLTGLFRLRGPVAPPADVVIVSIDRASSIQLGLPDNPRKWPRDLHARLLDRLSAAGARVVAFDVIFDEPRDLEQDRVFADAIRRAGNVVLYQRLKKEFFPVAGYGADSTQEALIEQRVDPIPVLADAAIGLAPFALPHVPIKVSQVWLFKPEAGGVPTMPVVALMDPSPSVYDGIVAIIRELAPEAYGQLLRARGAAERPHPINERAALLRELLRDRPSLAHDVLRHLDGAPGFDTPEIRLASALVAAAAGPDSIHLNYYGPPRTIETLSYYQVLSREPPGRRDLAGRAVFVGAAAALQPDQRDGFNTPYTLPNGLDISGVEIAATTFANLSARNQIVPLSPGWEIALVLVWGVSLGLGLRRFSGWWIPSVGVGVGAGYFGVAYVAFVQAHLWLPLVTPLMVQLPLATFGALLWRYRDLHQERENIRHAFGMHLPLAVVDQLARGIDDLKSSTEHAFGICLASDAEDYTTLSERLEPGALKQCINSYYEALFPPVISRGGVVADVVGDAMLAIWVADGERPELRRTACEAALAILDAVDDFNDRNPEHRLPTRLGLHCGALVLGHIGAVDHFEYRAVGDIVNTTSRIEGLGKQLGPSLLVSEDLVAGLEGLPVRPLGRFLLKGKTRPLSIAELMRPSELTEAERERLCNQFAQGLEAFRIGDWSAALACFEALEKANSGDGPTEFYLRLCRRYALQPPEGEWAGVIRMEEK